MNDTKNPLKSLGIIGPAASLIVFLVNMWKPGLGLTEAELGPAIEAGSALFGFVTGIIGRWRAKAEIKVGG